MGVWPRGAHVRRTFGINKNPHSSAKARWAFRRRAFFYPGPAIPFPALDGRLIALERAPLGLLARPVQGAEHATHVRSVQAHAKFPVDDRGDPPSRPQFRLEAPRRGAAQQEAGQPRPLPRRQLWRSARGRLCRQGREATPTDRVPPQDDGTMRTSEPAGDFRDRSARFQQVDGAAPPPLELLGASMGSHARRVYERKANVYYLCTDQ